MRVLIVLQTRRIRRYLINLFAKSLVYELRELISRQEYAKAIDLVYYEGMLEREVMEEDLPQLEADLILSNCSANWDMVK